MIKRWSVMIGVALVVVLLLLAFGRDSSAFTGNQANTVQVIESDFSITSSQTSFEPGMTYHFVIVNDSADPHEFMIGPKMPDDMPMDQMHKMMLAMVDNIAPYQSAMLDVTFPMTMATPAHDMGDGMGSNGMSQLEFSCHLPGHYEAGMMLPIKVSAG